jgi:hypothetical protein
MTFSLHSVFGCDESGEGLYLRISSGPVGAEMRMGQRTS